MDHYLCGEGPGMAAASAEGAYDFRDYDRIWQRVAPSLAPYPGMETTLGAETAPISAQSGMMPVQQLGMLPGAQENLCCMGAAAQEMLGVLQGFIESEMADRRYYLAFARQAPASARQTLRAIAAHEGEHARRLMTVYYLITGRCYQPSVSCDRVYIGAYCPALRERYHAEACGGWSYLQAAEATTDPCLSKILKELSEDEYRHAEDLAGLLEQAISGR